MKVLVTGATGFIGRRLTERLAGNNFKVAACGRSLSKLDGLIGRVRPVYMELEDKKSVLDIVTKEKPEIIFHCAALIASRSLRKLRRVNVEGTGNVFEACLRNNVKRVIYLSSIAVVSGNRRVPIEDNMPYKATNLYGASKIEAEKVALEYRRKGLNIAILRPSFVYGSDEPHLFPTIVKLIGLRLLPILGDGNKKVHLVNVDNVVDVMMLSISNDEACKGTYLIADKKALTFNELFTYIADLLHVKPPLHIPICFAPILTRIPMIGRQFSFYLKERAYSTKRLEERLGYTPKTTVFNGLKQAVSSCVSKR